jgi:hypothetical protein
MEVALKGEETDARRKAKPVQRRTGELFDVADGLRRPTLRAAPLSVHRFVAGLAGIPDTGLRPAPPGVAEIGCSATRSEVHNRL